MFHNNLTYSESSINSTAYDFIPKRKSKVLFAAGKLIKLKIHKFRDTDLMSFLKPVNKKLVKMIQCTKSCDTKDPDNDIDYSEDYSDSVHEVSYIDVKTQDSEDESSFDGDIQGISVISDTRIVLTDSYNRKVKLVDTTQFTVISELWVVGRPWEIANIHAPPTPQTPPTAQTSPTPQCNVQSQVAVTLPHNKQILLLTINNDTLELYRHIPARGQCWGIASIDNKLIISYQSPCCIKILSLDGKILKSIIKESEALLLFINPKHLDISVDHCTIYVSDSGKNTLTSFPINGDTTKLNVMVGLSGAAGVCAGRDNSIYICDFGDSCVLYRANCDMSDHCGFSTGRYKPISVAVCYSTDRLYIGMWKKDMIRVESLSTITAHKFYSSLTKSTSSSSSLSKSLTTSISLSSSPSLFTEQLLLEEYRHTWQ